MGCVLIIDDNEDLRFSLSTVVRKEGFAVEAAGSGEQGLELLQSTVIDLLFLDIGLPDTNGISLIPRIRDIAPDIGIVMLTGINEAKTAVDALKAGALDYIVKPFDIIEFKSVLNRLMRSRLMEKKVLLDIQANGPESIIGTCESMCQVKSAILTAAQVESPVLISGETGTGKEIVARAIHDSRQPPSGLFVKVDCGTLSDNLIESELFGYDKGAFTDARTDKKGLIETASSGTLFLDEIGNLPVSLQPKLLRLIEESTFRKVGGLKDIKVQVRIIAATNSDLRSAMERGLFREDLFYRLNVLPISLPPLRDRGDDIALLAEFFLHRLNADLKKKIKGFSPQASKAIMNHDWPGNIRELRNMLEREVIFSQSEWLTLSELCRQQSVEDDTANAVSFSLKEAEKKHIRLVLRRTGNNKSAAARLLGISRTTLRQKISDDQPDPN